MADLIAPHILDAYGIGVVRVPRRSPDYHKFPFRRMTRIVLNPDDLRVQRAVKLKALTGILLAILLRKD